MTCFEDDFVVGGRRWALLAPRRRYGHLVGRAYRVRPQQRAGVPDLRLRISEAVAIDEDPPVSAHMGATHPVPSIDLTVHDPSIDDRLLQYFLWAQINAALVRLGEFLVHAASFTDRERTVLVTGPSGAGKSTLALAFGLDGAVVHGEDWSFARPDPSGITVSGVTSTMRISDATRERLVADRIGHAVRSDDERQKWVFDGGTVVDADPAAGGQPDRIFLLRVGTANSVRPATPAEVTRHLFEESKATMYLPDREGLGTYFDCCASLAVSAPAFHLERDPRSDSIDHLMEIVRST